MEGLDGVVYLASLALFHVVLGSLPPLGAFPPGGLSGNVAELPMCGSGLTVQKRKLSDSGVLVTGFTGGKKRKKKRKKKEVGEGRREGP